jgi:hypothetical protein
MADPLDKLRSEEPLKHLVEVLLNSRHNDDFRLAAIVAWVVEELEQTLLGPSPAAEGAFIAAIAVEPLDMVAVMQAMKQGPPSVPQPIRELFAPFRLHPNRWLEFQGAGWRKRLEIGELVKRPEWAHLASLP